MNITPFISKLAHKVRLGALYDKYPSYWNYAIAGGTGVIIQYLVTGLFIALTFPWWAAMALGIFVAWNANYVLNKRWVFNDKPNSPKSK